MLNEEYEVNISLPRSDIYFLLIIIGAFLLFNTLFIINNMIYFENAPGRYFQAGLLLVAMVSAFGRAFHSAWQEYETVYFGLGLVCLILLIRASDYGRFMLGLNLEFLGDVLLSQVSAFIDITSFLFLFGIGLLAFANNKQKQRIKIISKWPDISKLKRIIILILAGYALIAIVISISHLQGGVDIRSLLASNHNQVSISMSYIEVIKSIVYTGIIFLLNTNPKQL